MSLGLGYAASTALTQAAVQTSILEGYYARPAAVAGTWAARETPVVEDDAWAHGTLGLAFLVLGLGLVGLMVPGRFPLEAYRAGAGVDLAVVTHLFLAPGAAGLAGAIAGLILAGRVAEGLVGRSGVLALFLLGGLGSAIGLDLTAGVGTALTGAAGGVIALAFAGLVLGSPRRWPACVAAMALAGLPAGGLAVALGAATAGCVGSLALVTGQALGTAEVHAA